MERTIQIDGKAVAFKATAAVPRLYRMRFGRDMIQDMTALEESLKDSAAGAGDLPPVILELFENAAYIMAKHADPGIPDSPEEWLDSFQTFSIYEVFPQIIGLWNLNTQGSVKAKKK